MKFLFISPHGDAAGLAWQLKQEDNDVWMYIPDEQHKPTLEGYVDSVKTVGEGFSKTPDVVIFDMVTDNKQIDTGRISMQAKRIGLNVVGSGAMFKGMHLQESMELDRTFGAKIMDMVGINQPETHEFTGAEIETKAIPFVKERKQPFVCKPNGNKSPFTSYVPEDVEDTINHLQDEQKKGHIKSSDSFILQEKIDGVEISTELWFSHGKPIYPASGTMETKKFLVGNLGPNTGCSSSVVWFYEKKEPKIVQTTLKKILHFIELTDYTGPLDINCMVSRKDKKPYGIEWTARPGYSALYAMFRLLNLKNQDLGSLFYSIATGDIDEFDVKPGFGYSVRVSIPPYPLPVPDEDKIKVGNQTVPAPEVCKQIMRNTAGKKIIYTGDDECLVPLDVKKGEEGRMVTAGVDCAICEMTGYGKTIEEAKNQAHSNLKKLKLENKQARLDGWKRPLKEIPILKTWGYEMPDVEEKKNEDQKEKVETA